MSKDRTRGVAPFLQRRLGADLTTPIKFPDSFLYFGAGPFLGHLDVLITQYGIWVEHTHGVACPCAVMSDIGGRTVAQPACTSCRGIGITYIDTHMKRVRALVSGIDAKDAETEGGIVTNGNLKVTFQSGHIVDHGDRLVFPDILVPIQFMRKYKKSVGGFILPFDAHEVEAIATKGRRPDDDIVPLKRGRDYALSLDSILTFPDGSVVDDGMVITASFLAVPTYIVDSSEHIARGRLSNLTDSAKHIMLPKYVTAVRADILINQQRAEVSGYGSIDG